MPTRQIDSKELQEIVREALGSLSERQRTAVLLHKFEGMSYQDIGDVMGPLFPVLTLTNLFYNFCIYPVSNLTWQMYENSLFKLICRWKVFPITSNDINFNFAITILVKINLVYDHIESIIVRSQGV